MHVSYCFLCMVLALSETHRPFHLHNELAYQIKASLNSKSRSDVDVRIELPFDHFLFVGGLQAGKFIKRNRGHDVYMITKFSSLAPLLGHQWHSGLLLCCPRNGSLLLTSKTSNRRCGSRPYSGWWLCAYFPLHQR